MKRPYLATALSALIIISGSALTATSASAASDTPSGAPLNAEVVAANPDAQWFAVAPSGEVLASNEAAPVEGPSSSPGDVATPRLIDDPIAWAACFTAHDEDYPLRSYNYWNSGNPKVIQLQCGYHDSMTGRGHGWHHISAGHETQWRQRIAQLSSGSPTGAGWDDLMSFVNKEVIAHPIVDVPRGSNSTRCVGAPIMMYDSYGNYEYTFYPSVVFGTDSKRVITSIPSSAYTC